MRIAITGSAGNVGSMLQGDMRLDLCGRAYEPQTTPGGVLASLDITRDSLEFTGYDVVIHLAALTDVVESFNKPDEYSFVNYQGTMRVAEAAKRAGAHLIFPSTPPQGNGCVSAAMSVEPFEAKSPYERSKFDAELFLHDNYPADRLTILRLGTVFGYSPGMKFQTVVNKFCKLAAEKKPLTVWRTAMHQQRPYLYIGDLVDTINAVVAGRITGTYNVQSTAACVADIVEVIRERIPGVTVEYNDSPSQNSLSFELDCAGTPVNRHWTRQAVLRTGIGEVLDFLMPVTADPVLDWKAYHSALRTLPPTPPSQASVCDRLETDVQRGYARYAGPPDDIQFPYGYWSNRSVGRFCPEPKTVDMVRRRLKAAFDTCTNAEAPGLEKALLIVEAMRGSP